MLVPQLLLLLCVSLQSLVQGIDEGYIQIVKDRTKRDTPLQVSTEVLKVSSVLTTPVPYLKKNTDGSYYGYLVDLLDIIVNRLTTEDGKLFNGYDISVNLGNKYGMCPNPLDTMSNGTGIIEEVVSGKVHIGAADMTITHSREKCLDFVQPYAHVGLGVVIKKPAINYNTGTFHYDFNVIKPLSGPVWAIIAVFLVLVWLFLWLMNRFNPYEYGEQHRHNRATAEEAERFDVTGSFWFTFTLLQWQGYDHTPRSLAAKVLGCVWMIFVTLLLVAYTGSYMNQLFWASTVNGKAGFTAPFSTMKELVDQAETPGGYAFGCVGGGTTYKYITDVAPGPVFEKIKMYFTDHPEALVTSTNEGLNRARSDKYAFILESPYLTFTVNSQPCDLMDTGIRFGMRSYGLAVSRTSPIKEKLHSTILEMIEDGEIEGLENKWFDNGECSHVQMAEAMIKEQSTLFLSEPTRLSLKTFWSHILIMLIGFVAAILVAVGEILWFKYRGKYDGKYLPRGEQLGEGDNARI